MEALEGKSVAVLGLGISGHSAARFCAERGAVVTAFDERDAGQIDGLVELGAHAGIELAVGAPFPDLAEFDHGHRTRNGRDDGRRAVGATDEHRENDEPRRIHAFSFCFLGRFPRDQPPPSAL